MSAVPMEDELSEERSKLKQGLITVLQVVGHISSAAAVVNPIFGVAGSLIRVVLHHVDDEDIRTLKREFDSVNRALDDLSYRNRHTMEQIKKESVNLQYAGTEKNLKNQFRKFMEIINAPPEERDRRKNDFKVAYKHDKGDQNLHTLYRGVVGGNKVFGGAILKVYLEQSQGDRATMERLCTRLTHLFCIGLIAFMGYTAIVNPREEEYRIKEWSKNMEKVEEAMQKVLRECH